MPPKSEANNIRQDVLNECDRVIALGRDGAKLTVAAVVRATGWGRTVIYDYDLHDLIRERSESGSGRWATASGAEMRG